MNHPQIRIEFLTIEELKAIGRELTPYRPEFRGKNLCAVDSNGNIIIRGLLRYSSQKDNYLQVLEALNLTYNRGQISSLGLTNASEVVSKFLIRRLLGPSDVLEIATTFICDELQLHEIGKSDKGKVLRQLAHSCITNPMILIAAINRAESMVMLDKLYGVAK